MPLILGTLTALRNEFFFLLDNTIATFRNHGDWVKSL